MSWAEVKKINSDLTTPLNILATIQHIDMVGDKYIGYGNIKGTVAILETNAVYAHEIARSILADLVLSNNPTAAATTQSPMAFKKCMGDKYTWGVVSGNSIMTDYCETKLSASTGVGEWLAFLADSDNATLKACNDMAAVIASSTAMTAVIASETAMTAVAASSTAMTAVAASSTAMTAVIESEIAMTAVIESEIAVSLILDSPTAIAALDNSTPLTIPVMTSNSLPSGIASTTDGGSGSEAWRAFGKTLGQAQSATTIDDYNGPTSLGTTSGTSLTYKFDNPVWIYRLYSRPAIGGGAASTSQTIKYEVSTDGINYIPLTETLSVPSASRLAAFRTDMPTKVVVGRYSYLRYTCVSISGLSPACFYLNISGK